jgi:hypothetical protein
MRVAVVRRPAVGHVTEDLCGKQGRCGQNIFAHGRGLPRLEGNLSLTCCWRGVRGCELAEASGRLLKRSRIPTSCKACSCSWPRGRRTQRSMRPPSARGVRARRRRRSPADPCEAPHRTSGLSPRSDSLRSRTRYSPAARTCRRHMWSLLRRRPLLTLSADPDHRRSSAGSQQSALAATASPRPSLAPSARPDASPAASPAARGPVVPASHSGRTSA